MDDDHRKTMVISINQSFLEDWRESETKGISTQANATASALAKQSRVSLSNQEIDWLSKLSIRSDL
jgi:hypothetical protein